MKWLIYLLLLANIGVFFWHFRPAMLSAAPGGQGDAETALSLVLLEEAREQAAAPAAAGRCLDLGPFATVKQASLAAAALKAHGIEARQRISREARRKAYWVLLPPAISRAEARETLARLKQLQISDYFLVPTGEKANAISLGVFSKFESAHRRIKQMQKLGFKPVFEKVELAKREYWLEWPASAGKPPPSALETLRRIRAEARIVPRPCAVSS